MLKFRAVGHAVRPTVALVVESDQNGNGASNGDGDIVLFGFTGDALIKDVTITGGANTVPTNANADTGIQINGRNPSSYDVTQPIGNVCMN